MPHIGVSHKGQKVEAAHQPQVGGAQGGALRLAVQEGEDQLAAAEEQQQGEQKSDAYHHDGPPEEAGQGAAVFFCPLILRHKNGDGLAAADAEGLAEVLHPGGGGEGGDGRCA